MQLYDYYRSSAGYRVQIALNLKGLNYTSREVHLLRDGGEQLKPEYRAINPQARVPSLMLDDGTVIIQSPAILEWLEETHPERPTLADVLLVPQVFNARRQAVPLDEFPKIAGVDAACAGIDAFARARPEAVRPARSSG